MAADTQAFNPNVPRAWNDDDVRTFETPLAQRDRSPKYLSADEYYALRVRPIYRGYPVDAPGREPVGYLDSLKEKEPEIAFDPSKLHTEQDWIRARELVFDATSFVTSLASARSFVSPEVQHDVPARTTPEGILPYAQYVIRKKGLVEFGVFGCGTCHTACSTTVRW